MLQPGVLRAMGGSLPIDFGPVVSGASDVAPGVDLEGTKITLPPLGSGGALPADAIRHELWHYILTNVNKFGGAPNVPQSLGNIPQNVIAQQPFAQKATALVGLAAPSVYQSNLDIRESGAISFGGADAYPGLTPTHDPNQFTDIFNPNVASWQYPTQTAPPRGWNIGK